MEKSWKDGFTFRILLLTGFALCIGTCAHGYSTTTETLEILFDQHEVNYTDSPALVKRNGHFSVCPTEYKDYCFQGKCRFVVAMNVPSCVCEIGYVGSRCELVDILFLKNERKRIIAASLAAALLGLFILIICLCLCLRHWRKKHRQPEKGEAEEMLETRPAENNNIADGSEDTVV